MITVLSVAYSLAPVAIDAVGGAEVVLAQIDRALIARGHRSIVVAAKGSRAAGTLIETLAIPSRIDESVRERAIEATRRAISDALERERVEVVHLHGLDFDRVLDFDGVRASGVPVLVTLHLPPDHHAPGVLARAAASVRLACVSASQRVALPAGVSACVVENGVDLARYRARTRKHGYALVLGRVCPEKGLTLAIEAARRARVPLLLAGQVHAHDAHVRYFEREIAPQLGAHARWIGAITGERKRRLLAGARCVVVPSLIDETSSLVAMEAFASGTPVVATRRGALPDIVEHGVTGFLGSGVEELARGIAQAPTIDPRACRAVAEARFDLARTTARWIALLEETARDREAQEGRAGAGA